MKLLLIGYGKMGKAIHQLALTRCHHIAGIIDANNHAELNAITPDTVDVALEFSQPDSAYANIAACLKQGIPVVSGTTGWLDRRQEIMAYCQQQKGTFLHATNFSIG